MRRRRLPSRRRRGGSTSLVKAESTTDLRFVQQVVSIGFPVAAAREYLHRNLGNPVRVKLVEVGRGEATGKVRAVEIRHTDGESTWVTGERVLANGQPASFYVPDHLVRVEARVHGAAESSGTLRHDDLVVLHVPVRGYLRFLPAIFQGDGPVSSREVVRTRDSALAKWGTAPPLEAVQDVELDEDPLRNFLFIFQHLNTEITTRIDRIADLIDPLRCDPKFLPWLASWVGFELDGSLPVHQQRELVRRAIRLYRTRGTRRGIEEMVRVLTSAPARIREREMPAPMALGKGLIIGGEDIVERYERSEARGHYLYEPPSQPPTSFFLLTVEPRERFAERFGERAGGVLRRIVRVVSQERPAHIAFTIQFESRG